jgi:helix-turn-helix protein
VLNATKKTKEHKEMLLGEPVYTVPEASAATGLSPWTLWDYLKCGKIMRSKIGGRTVIRESELKKLLVDKPKK